MNHAAGYYGTEKTPAATLLGLNCHRVALNLLACG